MREEVRDSAGEASSASGHRRRTHLVRPPLVEDDLGDLYDNAPCGFVSTLPDGTIAKVNATLLTWLGCAGADLIGRRRFVDLLAPGSRLLYETRCVPLLR